MVRLWAEKEMRNLKRLRAAGIRAPEPLEVRENVLVMSFLGDPEGWASPRLKDAELPADAAAPLYVELLLALRILFHRCRLVHADLSEYNILYHEEHLYIIDVSQSVEHDHPSAFDFLRNDLKNAEDFFARRGVRCLGLRRAFEFVTRDQLPAIAEDTSLPATAAPTINESAPPTPSPTPSSPPADESTPPVAESPLVEPPETADTLHASAVLRAWLAEDAPPTDDDGQDAAVFLRAHIPRSLNEVFDPERDAAALARGDDRGLVYADALGLVPRAQAHVRFEGEKNGDEGVDKGEGGNWDGDGEEDDSDEDGDEDEDAEVEVADGEDGGFEDRQPRGHRHEDRDAKKVNPLLFPNPAWSYF
jgi:RIO kinase 1